MSSRKGRWELAAIGWCHLRRWGSGQARQWRPLSCDECLNLAPVARRSRARLWASLWCHREARPSSPRLRSRWCGGAWPRPASLSIEQSMSQISSISSVLLFSITISRRLEHYRDTDGSVAHRFGKVDDLVLKWDGSIGCLQSQMARNTWHWAFLTTWPENLIIPLTSACWRTALSRDIIWSSRRKNCWSSVAMVAGAADRSLLFK